ncbi:unnamed protein product [Oikopleura dioica]|uniref:Uncharacterized protein n=1 Tax=Oikopleura dioica TaxID=34765 RepID=E4X1R2_OIKDI|nr:unnamed protein product [Oikopleura dioica]CBY36528.1 unnamed protein product [Oikopleura dioica]
MAPTQYPQTGVVVNQPVAYAQGAWIRPDLCGLCCDGTCCYAACCAPCARGEQAQLMGGSYCASFLIRSCFFCFSVCVLSSERNQIRMRYNIPATDGFCTVLCCESCVLAQHLYQLRGVRPPF